MKKIVEKAYAKINLTLSSCKKRFDNYHEIDSVMHSISLHDVVVLEKSDSLELFIEEGNAPCGHENLMWRVAQSFFEYIGKTPRVKMTLYKKIPSEAGLGGGSSDAAAVLRGLNTLTCANLSMDELCEIGKKHGADIPFCIYQKAARCGGIGDKIEVIKSFENVPLIIVKPHISVSTGKAYDFLDANIKRNVNTSDVVVNALLHRNLNVLVDNIYNDFEFALFSVYGELFDTYKMLKKVTPHVQMTGSGSAFFIICNSNRDILVKKLKDLNCFAFIEKAVTV